MIAPILLAIASLASLSAAQVGLGNQTIVPTSVDVNTRNGWCIAEKNTCTTLCNKNWQTNDCDINTLAVNGTCVCSDGSEPDLVNYRDTLPFFICQAYIAQCVAGNATEPTLQEICRNSNTCGNLDPADFVASTTLKSTSAPTTSADSTNTGAPVTTTGASTSSPTTSPNAAAAIEAGSTGLMRAFALIAALGLAGAGLVL
ncbi:hypothetical protein H072_8711 [Dactylellina haptotyla CBS 200.50]|uniref:DUF7707 domain-containing protein n=1 Tax=Dactylellina haptotyla (strain CBS 200.50) TaxID=1284197 RepID=S8A3J1_DACHA|nr:hypothetical protein H072_8711 [Dactylellina haptotyla CBS 200.50]